MQVSEVYKNEEALTVKLGAIINDLYASGLPAPFTNKEGLALNWFRVKKKKHGHIRNFFYILMSSIIVVPPIMKPRRRRIGVALFRSLMLPLK